MSKILINNNKEWNNKLKKCFKSTGFSEFKSITSKVNLTVYKKLKAESYNFYQENDDYIACCGTFIYKETLGKEALKSALNDLRNNGITNVRKNAIGNFAIAYKIGNKVRIFIDRWHMYNLYYYNKDNNYIITNTFYHIEKCVNEDLSIITSIRKYFNSSILDNRSVFENIFLLTGEEYIEIDTDNDNFSLVRLSEKAEKHDFKNIEDAAKQIADEIRKYAVIRKKLFKTCTVATTGGCDSRINIASYSSIGHKPNIVNWHSQYANKISSATLCTDKEDTITGKRIAEKYGNSYKLYDISESYIDNYKKTNQKSYDKYGEWAIYLGNSNAWHNVFENGIKTDFIDFGSFIDTLVGWDFINQRYKKPCTLKDYVEKIYVFEPYVQEYCTHKKEYNEYLYNEHLPFIKYYDMDVNNLSEEDCMTLYTNHKLHTECHFMNIANLYFYCSPFVSHDNILPLVFSVKYDWFKNKQLNLRITKELCESLLDIPYFSCRTFMKFDKEKLSLEPVYNSCNNEEINRKFKEIFSKIKRGSINESHETYREFCIQNLRPFSNKIGIDFCNKTFYHLSRYSTFLLFIKMLSYLKCKNFVLPKTDNVKIFSKVKLKTLNEKLSALYFINNCFYKKHETQDRIAIEFFFIRIKAKRKLKTDKKDSILFKKIIKNIFSVTNIEMYKVLTIMGIKFKFYSTKLDNRCLKKQIEHLNNKIDKMNKNLKTVLAEQKTR